MERKVDEVFEFNGIKLKVKRTNNPAACDGCYFDKFNNECRKINVIEETGLCYGGFRRDKNDVIFVEVEDSKDKEK